MLPGESCERVLEYMNYDKTEILDSIGKQLRVANRPIKKDEIQAIYRSRIRLPAYTYLEVADIRSTVDSPDMTR